MFMQRELRPHQHDLIFDGTKGKLKLNRERHGKADDKDTYGRVSSKKLKKLSNCI